MKMVPKASKKACRESYFTQFELQMLQRGEDPAVFKWELEQILLNAELTITESAKTALLVRQFTNIAKE